MNQNPPPRGPDNPYYGADGKEHQSTLNPNPMQNQQGHYPTPQPGVPPHGPSGPVHGGPGPAGGYPPPVPPGFGHPPGPGHYPPYPPGYGVNPHDTTVMSTKDWLLTLLICVIPCVNIIMLFVWAFSGSGNHNRRNYSRAYLILIAIVIGLYFMFWIFVGGMLFNWTRWMW